MNLVDKHQNDSLVSAISLFKGELGTATSIRLGENGILKEHITKNPALLLCVQGRTSYHDEKGVSVELFPGDFVEIEVMVKHWLEAKEDSQLILLK